MKSVVNFELNSSPKHFNFHTFWLTIIFLHNYRGPTTDQPTCPANRLA